MNSLSDLNLLRTFVKLAELKSFTKAAGSLNQPKSRVSRAVSRLEAELGVPLVRRTTRHTSLTSTGQALYERTYLLLESLEAQLAAVSESSDVLSGEIVVTAPEDISETILGAIIKRFRLEHPSVYVRVLVTNEFLNLHEEGVDVAIRIGRLRASQLIQKKLARVGVIAVAAPEYLKKYGSTKMSEVQRHRFLLFEKFDRAWLGKAKIQIEKEQVVTQANSFPLLAQLALDSLGITFLPEFFCKRYLNDGRLVHVFKDWKINETDVWALYPPAKPLPKKTRAFIDVLISEFKARLG